MGATVEKERTSYSILRKIRSLGGEGILSVEDMVELGESTLRVLALMCDGKWHDAEQIRSIAGKGGRPATSGLRRMRELRKYFPVAKRRQKDGDRLWEYKLVIGGRLF